MRELQLNIGGTYITDSSKGAHATYAHAHVTSRQQPIALTMVAELSSGFQAAYIRPGSWPTGTPPEQRIGVKPNQQQMHIAPELHINNFVIQTHPKSTVANKEFIKTFELWTTKLDTTEITVFRYPNLYLMILGHCSSHYVMDAFSIDAAFCEAVCVHIARVHPCQS